MGACRVVGGEGKEGGLAVCVEASAPLFPVVPVAGGGISSRGVVVAIAVVGLGESCAANSVSGVRMLSASWS